ncbi:hypothetical protein [Neomicrococcus lactis]|uniref:hypothetical protein n=1 Tax=Neomicrococcus lactis TaxID=732241 RepID=UPI002301A2BF|nr:hypothetical protein [Neomicrococcus lactis]
MNQAHDDSQKLNSAHEFSEFEFENGYGNENVSESNRAQDRESVSNKSTLDATRDG